MKKKLALGAMAMVLGLSYGSGVAPALAVSAASEVSEVSEVSGCSGASAVSAADVAAAVTRAEEAIAKTANVTVNAKEVAAMREYLQGWVAQARALDLERLATAQLKELVAALDEGALGLRLVAGVDRKTTSGNTAGSAVSSKEPVTSSTGSAVIGSVAEPRTVKELPAEGTVSEKTTEVSEVSTAKAEVAVATDATVAPTTDMKNSTIDMKALATLAAAQVKKPTAVLASVGAENAEVDVPKTGANDEEEQTSNAVRGMGLVLGGAVVMAAVGAVLIVKRMKRGL